ncbi:AMED_5909 family protein [Saccharothrix deserti]|uniref:AMED_5909 family protein n=1 Tax=Saccharothrix deserti TaxID=2593674 RepID=UPI00131D494F|nr:AMED_5909 family protein [Saccharothrix deserti]
MLTRQTATWEHVKTVSTFEQARHLLGLLSPAPDASADAWIAYHRKSAAVYRRVSKTDPDHQHEATGYAAAEEIYAERIGRKAAS